MASLETEQAVPMEAISPEWQRIIQLTNQEVESVDIVYPERPTDIQAQDLDRKLDLQDLAPKGDAHTEEEVCRLLWQLRERLAFHLQKAIKSLTLAEKDGIRCSRFHNCNNSIREFSLKAALRLVMSFTVTEDLIEFLISPFSGFQTEAVEQVDGDTQTDQDDIADQDVVVISVEQTREWISTSAAASSSRVPEEKDLKDQTKTYQMPLNKKNCIIAPIVQHHSSFEGVDFDHCYGIALCGLSSRNGKRLVYFDPMTNNKKESEDGKPDIVLFRDSIINPGSDDHHMRINPIKSKVVATLKKNGMPSLKSQNLKVVFAEDSGIILAHTISKMRANPSLLLLPAVTKVKGRTPYQLSNQKALFDPEDADSRLAKATIIAWFRVLVFLEKELDHLASEGTDGEEEDASVFFDDKCSFEDHPVPNTIDEECLHCCLYTSAVPAAMATFMQAERDCEWDKLFFLAFRRRVDGA
ncbi:hypothetical protein QFC21_003313 [Naganishia friedmannii]|uniref:Uncharacterized protein n=1 Tax=Naganishia friedmannii TaxID=89922 RepID=A0ACC2VNV1_9TREE|nr:hypothetical protein QFC21_003313 [Naganishia friedmannii]